MPFIGQDWRSPGEVWIKTIEGWEPMKLLRKSHFARHQVFDNDGDNNNATAPSSNVRFVDDVVTAATSHRRVVVLPSSSSSSLSSSLDSQCSSSTSATSSATSDSDSDGESIVGPTPTISSHPVPIMSGVKTRHQSGDSVGESSISSLSLSSSPEQTATTIVVDHRNSSSSAPLSVAEIIQRLQRSSSQPIPIDILKESSEQIEIYHTQPYYRITLNPTREVQGSNIISDAFYKLDFCNAIRDIRRFAYVSKLLHLLITQNLTSLSGNATKALFWMLEEIAKQVASNKQNIHVIRELLVELREIVDKYLCWGRPLGSTSLWEQHLRTMERICEMTDAIEIVPPEHNGKPSWSELPEELIREILLRLSDYKDLERSAQACQRMNSLLNEEQHIWKQLVKYHFTKDQLKWALNMINNSHHQSQQQQNFEAKCNKPPTGDSSNIRSQNFSNGMVDNAINGDDDDFNGNNSKRSNMLDWEQLFHLLRKKFGLKEEYADCLFLCRYCRCLFWKSKNHPCILENPDLTRQVLVTSPLTGFTSTTNAQQLKFSKNRRKFLSGQLKQELAASLPPLSSRQQQQQQSSSAPASAAIRSEQNRPQPVVLPPQPQPLPGGPVIVQNIPFFEHPLVIQRLSNNRQMERNNNNGNNSTTTNTYQKAPLHVPITPQAFLKFFSL